LHCGYFISWAKFKAYTDMNEFIKKGLLTKKEEQMLKDNERAERIINEKRDEEILYEDDRRYEANQTLEE